MLPNLSTGLTDCSKASFTMSHLAVVISCHIDGPYLPALAASGTDGDMYFLHSKSPHPTKWQH